MSIATTLLARQPIYDVDINIAAFELLFRSGEDTQANVVDGDAATSQVILNAFTELPVEDVLEGKPAYINFTRKLLDNPPPIDSRQVVVEILEDITVDEKMVSAVRALKNAGYTIALDDYVFSHDHHHLLDMADIIKVDILHQGLEGAEKMLAQLAGFELIFLAEKVETHEQFLACKAMGFTLFQGFFLAKPQLVRGKKVSSNQRSVLRLLAALQNPESEIDEIESAISADPVLSYKLLRLVNSARLGLSGDIDSVRRALTLLGLVKVESWATLLAMTSHSQKPEALSLNTMVRARMMQLLGERVDISSLSSDRLFTAGLISAMDAFLDIPLADVMEGLGLSEELQGVIVDHKGTAGLLLATAIYFEQARLDDVNWPQLLAAGLDRDFVEQAYLQSIHWADENIKQL